jgi:hypothetical protein
MVLIYIAFVGAFCERPRANKVRPYTIAVQTGGCLHLPVVILNRFAVKNLSAFRNLTGGS